MIVVTGADGQLGTAFRRVLGDSAQFLRRADLDVAVPGAEARIADLEASLVINCAAYNAVDRAEDEPEVARQVNAFGVGRLAGAAAAAGARFVTYSSDYVFAGDSPEPYVESSVPQPINRYGASKRDGEIMALAAHPQALVIRTSWVLSGTHPNFAATMLRLARQGGARVVDDQIGRPTLVDDLAAGTMRAVDAGAAGLLHLTNQGTLSWFDLAREVVDLAGMDPELIQPCTTAEFPKPAARPAFSVLGSERLGELGIEPLPHYRPALAAAVAQLAAT